MFIAHIGDLALAALANFPATRHGVGYLGRLVPPKGPTFLSNLLDVLTWTTNRLLIVENYFNSHISAKRGPITKSS